MLDYKVISFLCMIVFSVIIVIIKSIIKNTKNENIKKSLKNIIDVTTEMIPLIIEAEKCLNYTSDEKKKFVESRILKYISNNSIDMDNEFVSNTIDSLVKFTKSVNVSKLNNKFLGKLDGEKDV